MISWLGGFISKASRWVADRLAGSWLDRDWLRAVWHRWMTWVYPRRWVWVNPAGESFQFLIADAIGERYRDGDYEAEVSAFLDRWVESGDRVLDAGAHHGYHTLLAAWKVGLEGCVVAVEPRAWNVDVLRENLAENGLSAWASVVQAKLGGMGRDPVLGRFDVAKIDVEGFEGEVLRRYRPALEGCRAVVVEVHPDLLEKRGSSVEVVEDRLRRMGFVVLRLTGGNPALLVGVSVGQREVIRESLGGLDAD